MPVEYMTTSEINSEHWLKLLIMNVKNGSLTDAQFREFVINTLPSVQHHEKAKQQLINAGRKIPGESEPRSRVSSAQFEDGTGESQAEYFGKK